MTMSLGGGRMGDALHHRAIMGPIGERIYGPGVTLHIPRPRNYAAVSGVVRTALEGFQYAETHPLPVEDTGANSGPAGMAECSRQEIPSEVMDRVLDAAPAESVD